jgi:hypothetical protein
MYTDHIDAMLDNALDMDITEFDFWNMTIGEFNRIYNSKMRVKKVRDQEVAIHNYILGDLIGRSMARLQSSSVTYPQIYEAYTSKDNTKTIANLKMIASSGIADRCLIRIPLIPGFNSEEDRERSMQQLRQMGFTRFDKFEYKTDINR